MSDDDDWDFYPCLVDDQPASMFLNLRYGDAHPSHADTLYWVRIAMRDPSDHGMGSASEADVLHAAEDAIVDALAAKGLIYVGRLRNDGLWQLTFYGPRGQSDAAKAIAAQVGLDGRKHEVGAKPDADWGYFHDFMWPEAERFQWMQDRKVVAALESHGDVATTPRAVFHWAYFPTAAGSAAFSAAAAREGFMPEESAAPADGSFPARVKRVDTTELHHIHAVVMTLSDLAAQHGGTYDGWETSVETSVGN